MINQEIPSRAWEKVGCDLFHFEDKHYLVCVDYYSDYFEVDRIFGKKGKEVISRIKSQFDRHGIPDQLKVTMDDLSVRENFSNMH